MTRKVLLDLVLCPSIFSGDLYMPILTNTMFNLSYCLVFAHRLYFARYVQNMAFHMSIYISWYNTIMKEG